MGELKREIGFGNAVLLGLGSIIGTGIYVSIAIVAGIGGPYVIPAILVAAAVASLNALSSAELAANHPVSGGTYEYGYRYLRPWLGFSAGWMFLCAKTASAATAAIGVASYLLRLFGMPPDADQGKYIAAGIVLCLTAVVAVGIRTSLRFNALLVTLSLLGLAAFIVVLAPHATATGAINLRDFNGTAAADSPWHAALRSVALMFVAFTGYARLATLGEEVHDPRRNIPRAIIATLWISATVYLLVAVTAVAAVGAANFAGMLGNGAAPLELAAAHFGHGVAARVIAVGAIAAMLGVMLNLLLGLSRVLLAMGRRGDMPAAMGAVSSDGRPNLSAVIVPGIVVTIIAVLTGIKAAWSFSAFSVLVYYALTNLAALQLTREERLFHRPVPALGLLACISLAAFIEWRIVLFGSSLLAAGLAWHLLAQRLLRAR